MPILHRRILPCLAPSCCCRWRPPRWPSRRRDPAREAALVNRITWGATPAELARIRELGPERYLQAQLHPAPAPPCRPRSSGASTPCRSRGNRTRMRRPNSAGCARTPGPDARRPGPGAAGRARDRPRPRRRHGRPRGLARVVLAQPAAGADDLVLDEPLQRLRPQGRRAPSSAAMKTAPSGRTRWQVPRPAGRDHPLAGHAAVPGQRAERGRQDQRELCARADGAAHAGRERRLYADGRAGAGAHPHRPGHRPARRAAQVAARAARAGGAGRLFLFNPARHDYGDKQFLGHRIAGAGLAEVDQAVDLLARHPATAHFISAKLAAFLGDAPPPALVDRMARTFLASDGDIAAVLQTLYASPEFARSLDAGVFRTRCTMCIRRCGWPMPACRPSSIPGPR